MLFSRKLTIKNGQQEYFAIEGNYVSVTEMAYTGALLLKTDNGDQIELYYGDEVLLKPFKEVILSHGNGGPIQVRLAVGTAGEKYTSKSTVGSVSILGTSNVIVSGNSKISPLYVEGEIDSFYSWYKDTTAVPALTANAVFLPAANVNGSIVDLVEYITGSATAGYGAFLAKQTTPTGINDGVPVCTPSTFTSAASYFTFSGQLNRRVNIPAGYGLYYISLTAEIMASRAVRYRLL